MLGSVRCILGVALVVGPDRWIPEAGGPPSGGVQVGARVLGARDLLQGVVTLVRPTPGTLLLGAGVDSVHAMSMALLAKNSTRLRPAAVLAARVATAEALAGILLAAGFKRTRRQGDSASIPR